MADFLSSLANDLVESVTVETAVTPSMTIDRPAAEGPPSAFLSWLKPTIDIKVVGKRDPIHWAPAGEPTSEGRALIYIVTGVIVLGTLALAVYGGYRLVK